MLLSAINDIFTTLAAMIWQIYWPLALGLMLSSQMRNLVPVDTVSKHLGRTTPKSLLLTTLLGMLSSSCSYAAASLSRTLLIKKASLANAMAFLVASTNLILEMFIVLVSLLGWQFLVGEIVGGLLLIVIVAMLFSRFFPAALAQQLRDKIAPAASATISEMKCSSEMKCGGHVKHSAEMTCGANMKAPPASPQDTAITTAEAASAKVSPPLGEMKCGASMSHDHADIAASPMPAHASHHSPEMKCGATMHQDKSALVRGAGYFHMDIAMIGKEILIGVVVSSVLIALVPMNWWQALFISDSSVLPAGLHSVVDVFIGIFVAVIAYVCSVGNLLLAAALWHGGISFGGVMAFILADVLTIPMTRVYQKYYGKAPAKRMVLLLFCAIAITGLILNALTAGMDWQGSRAALSQLNQDVFGLNFTSLMNIIVVPLSFIYYHIGKKANAGMSM
ncbi:permease [Shewanella sp. NIFS-20-20]|uniref:permease n=1 Tax=Shewanella sp. NIFS-20-20 TaxID=2853806 RepID=UPI001C48B836|nr:permease [Shewanella sp. NIFS-20-20]MBV7315837.1 permease [Shewanella sp. NIFS-20-20]